VAILAACIVVIEFNHDNSASPPHKQGGPHRVLTQLTAEDLMI
jgi:hypothetical protein